VCPLVTRELLVLSQAGQEPEPSLISPAATPLQAAGGAQEPRLRSAHLLDLLAPKMAAVIAAVEAAAAVLTMDGVLLSEGGGAEGGPLVGRC
jgi:hypothetical protein